jgi:hypothetical protein
MKSEHLANLHPGWVVGGWLVAIAVTALIYLGGIGLGLVPADDDALLWVSVSIAIGFFAGGFFVGIRWAEAPILHAMAITLFSVLVWFVAALLDEPVSARSLTAGLGLILLQLVASMGGGWAGRRMTLGGGTAQ